MSNSRVASHAAPAPVVAGHRGPVRARRRRRGDRLGRRGAALPRAGRPAGLAGDDRDAPRRPPAAAAGRADPPILQPRPRRVAPRPAPPRAPALPLRRLRPPARPRGPSSCAWARPTLRDTLPLDREQYLAQAHGDLARAPRRPPRHPPVHLGPRQPPPRGPRPRQPVSTASPSSPVRYGTRMRLRFWYLIAPGTEGECRARIAQYKDSPERLEGPLRRRPRASP